MNLNCWNMSLTPKLPREGAGRTSDPVAAGRSDNECRRRHWNREATAALALIHELDGSFRDRSFLRVGRKKPVTDNPTYQGQSCVAPRPIEPAGFVRSYLLHDMMLRLAIHL
jgi:hypothetical protein